MKETQQHEYAAEASTTLKYGDEGNAVQELQQQLRHIGYCDMDGPVHADGDFGRRTHHAIIAFQRDYGLLADGIAGLKTWQALRHALRHLARKQSRLG
ncbi:MAG TPA: peptidoglycan-binding domain-containing protein [Dyella sp.]|nr:peptidoglycan-binding domain-containing protein [Dyella sp.]